MTTVATAVSESRAGPLERLESLCDKGSFEPLRSAAISSRLGPRARSGDGVVGGLGAVEGRRIACYAQDEDFLGGSLGVAHADTIARVLELAYRAGVPVVGCVESAGARIQEGTAALSGYSRIFRHNVRLSGVVPQISVIGGLSAGGGCYSPALTDFVIMTKRSAMFLTGPAIVREAVGEEVATDELGGHRVHERNGVCDIVAADDRAAAGLTRALLSYLPQRAGDALPRTLETEPELTDPSAVLPADPKRIYDMRKVLDGIVDQGSQLELAPRWARNLVTVLARIDGRPVGVIANQPRHLGGVLDTEASQKGARFVDMCNRYGIPLVVLVDTPGFLPGSRQERAGVIRFGATLVRAFAAATVPRLTVVVRKAYGGAYITMNSKDLGADMVFAWPGAELGVMGSQPAVGFVHRRQIEDAADPVAVRERLAAAYAREHLSAEVAAATGIVDEVIDPPATRRRLVWALTAIGDRRASSSA